MAPSNVRVEQSRRLLTLQGEEMLEERNLTVFTLKKLTEDLDQLDPKFAGHAVRDVLDAADRRVSILRAQLRNLRKFNREIHKRKEQQANGVFAL